MASVIGTLALIVALSGTAVASNGGHLTLGAKNRATKPTTIANSKGVALVLAGKPGVPPLSVGTDKTQVPSLDASLLAGLAGTPLLGVLHAFTTPGGYQITIPATVHSIKVIAVGGGGGGGGSGGSGGGGQGGYVVSQVEVTPGEQLDVGVGRGGSGGAKGAAGDDGGRSSVTWSNISITTYLVLADSGDGGAAVGPCPSGGAGGAGGRGDGRTSGGVSSHHGLATTDGASGGAGTWRTPCPSKVRKSGKGTGAGFPGAGGDGGTTSTGGVSTPGHDGGAGAVFVEYLR